MHKINHAAICRVYAEELLDEPAVSKCLRAAADEIDMLRGGIDLMQEQNAALSLKNAQLQAAATPDAAKPEVKSPVAPAPVAPDAGEGWRWLQVGEILQPGDEIEFSRNGIWSMAGYRLTAELCRYRRYRRRVTPVPATEASPETTSVVQPELDWDEHQWRRRAYKLADENARLTAEVARLKASESALLRELQIDADQIATQATAVERLTAEVERLQRAANSWERESVAHAEEVERLRLRPEGD